jgi:hypothetical protein
MKMRNEYQYLFGNSEEKRQLGRLHDRSEVNKGCPRFKKYKPSDRLPIFVWLQMFLEMPLPPTAKPSSKMSI